MAINTTTTVYGNPRDNAPKKGITSKLDKKYGMNYPAGTNTNGGYFSKAAGVSLIKGNVLQLLRTERGERVMLPNYGISLRKYLFEPLDKITFAAIQREILSTIATYEPRVNVLKLNVAPSNRITSEGVHTLIITLNLQIKEESEITFDAIVEIN